MRWALSTLDLWGGAGAENIGKEQVWTDRKSLWDLSEESGDI